MNIPGAVLENYREPRAMDFSGMEEYLRRVDNNIANMASMTAQGVARGMENKRKDSGDGADYISKLDVPDIGDTTVDLYNDSQMKGLQDKLMEMQKKGAGVNEIKMAAIPELQKIAQGYTIAKNEYNKITNGVKDLTKDYPTGDMEAARNVAGSNMLKNIFEFDENGKVKGYKDPSIISTDKNYMQDLTTNQNLPKWYRRSGDFEKGIKDIPLFDIKGGTSRTDKNGRKVQQTFTGHGSVFDEPVFNDAGEQTGLKLKSEAVPLGRNPDGSLIIEQVMPKEQFSLIMAKPAARLDFETDFNNHLEKELGINPDALDSRATDVLKRKYAYDLFRKTNIHGSSFLPVDIIKEAPVKNVTNNNIRVGGGKDVPVMDIVTPVNDYLSKNSDAVVTYDGKDGKSKTIDYNYAPLNQFDNEVTSPIVSEVQKRYPGISADHIYYRGTGDGTWVMKTAVAGKVNPETDIPVFKLNDFSNVSGNRNLGKPSQKEALKNAQSGNTGNKQTAEATTKTMKGADGKTYSSTDGITWIAPDGTVKKLNKKQ